MKMEIIQKIFKGMDVKLLDERTPVFRCDCSRERLTEMLISLGPDEITDMIEKDKGAQVTCRFCCF